MVRPVRKNQQAVIDAAEQLAAALVAANPTPPALLDLAIAVGERADQLEAEAAAMRSVGLLLRADAMEAAGLFGARAE